MTPHHPPQQNAQIPSASIPSVRVFREVSVVDGTTGVCAWFEGGLGVLKAELYIFCICTERNFIPRRLHNERMQEKQLCLREKFDLC